MKITMFVAHMNVGGAQRVCISLANEFIRLGHDVTIISLNLEKDKDVNTQLLDSGCHLVSLGADRIRYAIFPMAKYIRKNKPEFMLVFGDEMSIVLEKLRRAHIIHLKLVQRVLNNLNITLQKEDKVPKIVENYLKKSQVNLRNMDHLISQCKGMEQMLLNGDFAKKENITTIYNPVSRDVIEKTEAIRIPFEKRDKKRIKEIVFVGRIDPQKNLSHLIKAFQILHKRRPDTCLRLVGDGNSRDSVKKLIEELGLQESVFLEGVTSHVEKFYAKADVVALSSEYEGMPNCLIEAIGCGIPVVSYDCKLGPSEIIEEGMNGYLIPYWNIDALADGMIKAVDREWDEKIIQESCRKFDVKNIAKQYIEVFEKL